MKRNKMTGKMLAGILAVGLTASAVVPAYAVADQTGEMIVSFNKQPSYQLSIPSSLKLTETTGASKAIGVSSINLPTDYLCL